MPDISLLVVLVLALALFFDFTNGWNDSANAIATVVATRVLKPLHAVLLAAALNLAGAFAFTGVAKTIFKGIADPSRMSDLYVVAAILIGAIAWNTLMTLLGLPISASHALIGGIVGAAYAYGGAGVLVAKGIYMTLLAMLVSPAIGIAAAYVLMRLLNAAFARVPHSRVRKTFGWLQLLSVSFMSFSHGTNDAQKTMGIMMMALTIGGLAHTGSDIPAWVKVSAGLAIAIGTAVGGWKVVKTMGLRLSKLEPIHGFAAETAAATILTTVSKLGIPVSSTHTITGSIIGVGLSRGLSSVRWGVAGKIVYAWVLTLPGTAVLSFVVYEAIRWLRQF
ncbi:MAG: anion permease [Candidatus Reconcilbacillus cellulovorans]|uniref:Anion permease n=1 Tax=Candidatus Reconcilbacillus cellulovorans TaxID=1906605 RepID=A0A2A6E3R3_9BACL|nr:MAG: anion permease [Candidatus Reconcilbacillus cellulovorans]